MDIYFIPIKEERFTLSSVVKKASPIVAGISDSAVNVYSCFAKNGTVGDTGEGIKSFFDKASKLERMFYSKSGRVLKDGISSYKTKDVKDDWKDKIDYFLLADLTEEEAVGLPVETVNPEDSNLVKKLISKGISKTKKFYDESFVKEDMGRLYDREELEYERLLHGLSNAKEIKLFYPDSLTEESAKKIVHKKILGKTIKNSASIGADTLSGLLAGAIGFVNPVPCVPWSLVFAAPFVVKIKDRYKAAKNGKQFLNGKFDESIIYQQADTLENLREVLDNDGNREELYKAAKDAGVQIPQVIKRFYSDRPDVESDSMGKRIGVIYDDRSAQLKTFKDETKEKAKIKIGNAKHKVTHPGETAKNMFNSLKKKVTKKKKDQEPNLRINLKE